MHCKRHEGDLELARQSGRAVRALLAALLLAGLIAMSACTTVNGPLYGYPPVGSFPLRDGANAAILAGELPRLVSRDLSSADAGSFESDHPTHSSRHYRDGAKSLMWAWNQPESVLVLQTPISYRKRFRPKGSGADHTSVFRAWIYSEYARTDGTLRISFGNHGTSGESCWLNFGLNFTGWRLICYDFDEMQGTPGEGMDAIRLSNNLPSGILFLDQVVPVTYEDLRWQWPDYQTADLVQRGHSEVLNSLWINSDGMRALKGQPMTAQQRVDVDRLKADVLESITIPAYSEDEADTVATYFATYGIQRDGLSLRGKALFTHNIRAFLGHYFRLAKLCRSAPRRQRPELTRTFLTLSEFLLDQGWAEGSALGGQHHFGYKSRAWAPALLLMEDELRAAGLLDNLVMALIWMGRDFTDFTAPFNALPERTRKAMASRLADYLNTFANTHLCSLLLLDDSQAKFVCLRNFTGTLEAVLTLGNSSIKPDGSFYHHKMHYSGYCIPAMRGLSAVVARLDGTAFEISPAAYARLKRTVWSTYIWGHPGFAFNAFGRHPLGGDIRGMRAAFRAAALSVPQSDATDPDLANILALVWGEKLLPEQKVERPQGYWSMNYHASGILKHGDYSVVSKGYHKHGVRPYEIYRRDNRYGRYGSHGSLMVFREGVPNHSGYQQDGWNWCQIPGATTLLMPFDVLEGNPTRFYGWAPPQDVPFSGSCHLDHEVGVFAFQIDGLRHEQSLEARKSVFAMDDVVVCLGSDIRNTSKQYPTITTLVQNGLNGVEVQPHSSWHGAYEVGTDVDEKQPAQDSPAWLIDIAGAAYLIPPGNAALRTVLRTQQSRHNKTKEPTTGRFFTAWLDHGTGPEGAGYEYAILLGATPDRLRGIASGRGLGYEVLHKSRHCHAVRFPEPHIDAYAFFEAPENSEQRMGERKNFLAVSRSALIMLKRDGAKLLLSACYPVPPILRPFDARVEPTELTLRINAATTVRKSSRKVVVLSSDAGQTVLTVEVCDGVPTRVELRQMGTDTRE